LRSSWTFLPSLLYDAEPFILANQRAEAGIPYDGGGCEANRPEPNQAAGKGKRSENLFSATLKPHNQALKILRPGK
jgi:hypothetical protein